MQATSRLIVDGPGLTSCSCIENVPRFYSALSILREAHDYARQLARPVWDFAVEIQDLRLAGMTNSDLRLLVCRGLVEHASEIAHQGHKGRVFERTGSLTFTKRTCFVLAEPGAAALPKEPQADALPEHSPSVPARPAGPPSVPCWDKERQELRVGELIVKQFKVPAPNQVTILATFEEDGWPPRIDDPLPPHPEQDPKRRLHDTITTLNRHHKHRLIRFSGDGSGEGVRWDRIHQSAERNGSD